MATATDYLYINTRDELHRFDCSKIVYMEGDGNYTNIVLVNKLKASVCMNLSEMQRFISESLKERASMFIRIGKRFIINVNFIYHINVLRQFITVTDGVHFAFQLGVSKVALRQLKDLMIQHANSKKLNNNN
ncbi:MAG: LytTR family transcriptional regulator DNA-binding domain-containing protein [Bacteroidaceae bacterium]|nr:LytTR family transcriptional regulator DNA-binding domain-containing protein [Bacteroidaceae bacterium]